jgi:hypothetical protein
LLVQPLDRKNGTLQLESRGKANGLQFMLPCETVEHEFQRMILKNWKGIFFVYLSSFSILLAFFKVAQKSGSTQLHMKRMIINEESKKRMICV